MLINKLNARGTTLAVGLILGLLGQQASAASAAGEEADVTNDVYEIVVYGNHQVALIRAGERLFAAEVERYLEALSLRLKSDLDAKLEALTTPKLQLAASEVPTRG